MATEAENNQVAEQHTARDHFIGSLKTTTEEESAALLKAAQEKGQLMRAQLVNAEEFAEREKNAFIDGCAIQTMSCMHSIGSVGINLESSARHAYAAAEALWKERQKTKTK